MISKNPLLQLVRKNSTYQNNMLGLMPLLLQLLYLSFSFLCNFGPISYIFIYFLLV